MKKPLSTAYKWISDHMTKILSWSLATYFLVIFHYVVGFPPTGKLETNGLTYLFLFILFLLLPLAQKIKLGKVLEFEAKVNEVKKEVKDFREETRQIFNMQNSLISTMSNTISNSVNINLPGFEETVEAKENLNATLGNEVEPDGIEREIRDFLEQEGDNLNFALAKLRMEIERELRIILDKRIEFANQTSSKERFLSAGALFRRFIKEYPKYQNALGSFDYILKICNAAIHGQLVPPGQAHEALYMGLRLLNELKDLSNGSV